MESPLQASHYLCDPQASYPVPSPCPPTFPPPGAAGAADGSLKVWDKRKLAADGGGHALFTFNHHTGAVLRAEWSPSAPGEVQTLLPYDPLICCCHLVFSA